MNSGGKRKKSNTPVTLEKRTIGVRPTEVAVSRESLASEDPSGGMGESTRSSFLPPLETEGLQARKRGRGDESESKSEDDPDAAQPKRPRIGERVGKNENNRLSEEVMLVCRFSTPLFTTSQEYRMLEESPIKNPPPEGRRRPQQKSRRVMQVLSSSPGPEDGEVKNSHLKVEFLLTVRSSSADLLHKL